MARCNVFFFLIPPQPSLLWTALKHKKSNNHDGNLIITWGDNSSATMMN